MRAYVRSGGGFRLLCLALLLVVQSVACTTTVAVRPPIRRFRGQLPEPLRGSRPVSITVLNLGAESICYVYISPVSEVQWGHDQLTGSEVIAPGAARQFDVPSGWWDVRTDGCDRAPLAVLRNAAFVQDSVLTVR